MNNFTPHAQQALAFARKEADRLSHNYVGTEHLLLGLIRLGQGIAVTVLANMELELETVRTEVEKQVGAGTGQKIIGTIPYSPRVKKVLALAAIEARDLNHSYVGTEHILLGLLREGEGVASLVLNSLGVDTEKTRLEVLKNLDPNFPLMSVVANPSGIPQIATVRKRQIDSIDTSKRYDVYCRERSQEVVVYRSALFKGRSKLLSTGQFDLGAEFLELEQANGQTIFLSLTSVIRFCDHGTEVVGEIIPPK